MSAKKKPTADEGCARPSGSAVACSKCQASLVSDESLADTPKRWLRFHRRWQEDDYEITCPGCGENSVVVVSHVTGAIFVSSPNNKL